MYLLVRISTLYREIKILLYKKYKIKISVICVYLKLFTSDIILIFYLTVEIVI